MVTMTGKGMINATTFQQKREGQNLYNEVYLKSPLARHFDVITNTFTAGVPLKNLIQCLIY